MQQPATGPVRAAAASAVFVNVLGIDPEADPGLVGVVSRILAVPLGLAHRLGECVLALVDERRATADRDVMQVVAVVVDDHGDPRIAADVGHPAAISVSVEGDVVLAKRVVDDDLAGRAVGAERRQHRTPRRGKEVAHWLNETPAVGHDLKGIAKAWGAAAAAAVVRGPELALSASAAISLRSTNEEGGSGVFAPAWATIRQSAPALVSYSVSITGGLGDFLAGSDRRACVSMFRRSVSSGRAGEMQHA